VVPILFLAVLLYSWIKVPPTFNPEQFKNRVNSTLQKITSIDSVEKSNVTFSAGGRCGPAGGSAPGMSMYADATVTIPDMNKLEQVIQNLQSQGINIDTGSDKTDDLWAGGGNGLWVKLHYRQGESNLESRALQINEELTRSDLPDYFEVESTLCI